MSSTASGINNRGDIVGFFTNQRGKTEGFLLTPRGTVIEFRIPRASSTMAFGINDFGEVAGTFMRGSGSNAKSFGFTWRPGRGFTVVNDPLGSGATTLNGINDAGDLVGFYTDAKGNTDGLLVARGTFSASTAPPVSTGTTPVTSTPTTAPTCWRRHRPVPGRPTSDQHLAQPPSASGTGGRVSPGRPFRCPARSRAVTWTARAPGPSWRS